jgi:hypothetical protein
MVVGELGIIADEATTIDAADGFREGKDADGCSAPTKGNEEDDNSYGMSFHSS